MLSAELIKLAALELGADLVGIAPVGPVESRARFLDWLEKGYAGEMQYMTRNVENRLDPTRLLPGARSVIVVGYNYFPTEDDRGSNKRFFKVARYARGDDYHDIIGRMLERLQTVLRETEPKLNGRVCVDTAAFMDKYWAQRAGLGWQGKHTVLVSRRFGSWLLLGSLVIDDEVDRYDNPHRDYCGKCTACLEACPHNAFPNEYVLDATHCTSYWTIESKAAIIPERIGKNMKRWVFGCDICLEACPFNRFQKPHKTPAFTRHVNLDAVESGNIAQISEKEFAAQFKSSPLKRPKLNRLIRNINACK